MPSGFCHDQVTPCYVHNQYIYSDIKNNFKFQYLSKRAHRLLCYWEDPSLPSIQKNLNKISGFVSLWHNKKISKVWDFTIE